ncbi:MAG: phase variable surface lipoprotein [Vigna little leaf phytoplasma]|nr:phase variable surface lipoprotein [Vigna little leaf phytoplasma]
MIHNQNIITYGRKHPQTPTDLPQIKHFLQTLKTELINLTIIQHSKKKNGYQEANYRPKNQTLFVDETILETIKNYKIDLIKEQKTTSNTEPLLSPVTVLKTPKNTLKTHFFIFQINYKDEVKNNLKELIGKINIHQLETLQLYPLDPQKRDKFNHPFKTNYQARLNILYYCQEDLTHLKYFLTKDKQGFRVKKLHPMYKYISKNK